MKIPGLKRLVLNDFLCYDLLQYLPAHQLQYAAMNLYSIINLSERATMKLAYRLKHALERLARHKNHLTFLLRCKENGITPDGLRVSLPLSSRGTQRIAKRTEAALLCLLIRDIRTKKVRIAGEANTCSEKIRALVDVDKWEMLESWCASAAETSYTETKSQQIQKFSRLLARHETRRLQQNK